ncbi:MAG: Mut7-C RNAse domain-containing protein, partial [Lentisphaeria bacterium]
MQVQLRFYEELNDFLPKEQRKQALSVPFTKPRSVKDLIESQGVPHTEVDLILANGESVGFDYAVQPGDRLAVYPKFETLNIAPVSALNRPPLRHPEFIADVHLGKLARHLRLLGFDCLFNPEWDDRDLAEISAAKQRVLLTRDRGLLKRAIIDHGLYVRSDDAEEQLREVVQRLDLKDRIQPVSRCLKCNGKLEKVPKEKIKHRIPKLTYERVDDYLQCRDCGKIFWRGTHWQRLKRIIENA